ncbi:hypothetical protein P8C59_005228 [Phyllachora maydis]|uniref:Spo12-like protein n=1 Tax=Phyllachora maydis TaxID=1825666 RepID=A0AAD9MFA5_9PEZI|nr:hypothetical protein P8C59_005228 [Phyllachora maydis]
MSAHALGTKDVNLSMAAPNVTAQNGKPDAGKDIMSMEYHRQVLQSKMELGGAKQYVSPSDNIMSPCTAKLNAFRNKQVGKVKPKSLFAQTSAKKLEAGAAADGLFSKPKSPPTAP